MAVLLIVKSSDARAAPNASHCVCLHNAIQQHSTFSPRSWGVYGILNWTDPDLRTGALSWHRVGVGNNPPSGAYAEFGWAKATSYCTPYLSPCALITVDDGTGPSTTQYPLPSVGTHSYSMQYDPNTSKYYFYIDFAYFTDKPAPLTSGDYVFGGGEVFTGYESMGDTLLSDLHYLVQDPIGNFVFVFWSGHEVYNFPDLPYYNRDNGPNSFYDTQLGLYFPAILRFSSP
jgi:hypothetical protein